MQLTAKWVSVASLTALLATTACSGGAGKPAGTEGEGGKAQSTAKPAEIKYFISDNNFVLPDGPLPEQPFVKYFEEKTNTKLLIETMPHNKYEETLRLKFASGDLPDLFTGYTLNYAGSQDRLLPLNELIDKYGQNLKKVIPKEAWEAVTINGKIIAIPNVQLTPNNDILYIRKDWMDRVGGAVPKTSDELLALLRLFRDNDPNGNGKKDEIPFTMREKFTWWTPIRGMWGVGSEYMEHEGNIIPSVIHPNMKQALGFLRQMYVEKLVDPEFLSNTGTVQDKKILSDLAGSFHHQTLSAENWNKKLIASLKDKKPEVITIPTPRGTGYSGPLGGTIKPSSRYWFVMKTAKNPEAIVRAFDWMATKEGAEFAYFGLEGDTFVREGDQYVFDAQKVKDEKKEFRAGLFLGVSYGMDLAQKQKRTPEEERLFQYRQEAIAISKKEGVPDVMNGLPDPEILKRFPDLKPETGALFQEAAAKIVLGKEPLDYFDTFVQDYRKQGGDDLIKELTANYKKAHGK